MSFAGKPADACCMAWADPGGTQGDGDRKYVGGGVRSQPRPLPPGTLLLIFGGPDIAAVQTTALFIRFNFLCLQSIASLLQCESGTFFQKIEVSNFRFKYRHHSDVTFCTRNLETSDTHNSRKCYICKLFKNRTFFIRNAIFSALIHCFNYSLSSCASFWSASLSITVIRLPLI